MKNMKYKIKNKTPPYMIFFFKSGLQSIADMPPASIAKLAEQIEFSPVKKNKSMKTIIGENNDKR